MPSLSRRRGDSLTFRYLHFYRLHTSLYPNTSSIRLNSYAYRLQSPLSRPSGASSPQGEPLIMLAAVDNLSHEPYTKSLSSGRGAELVEAERGFANLSLFARHLIACFFIAQLIINTTYFICLQTAVPSQSP